MIFSSQDDRHSSSNAASQRPTSSENTYDFVGNVELQRWIVAATIALCIITLVTGMAFWLHSMWRWRQDPTAVKPVLSSGIDLLGVVACNSTLCNHYKELISSCTGGVGKSPCAGLSDFVCGEGVCYGRPIESLLRGLLRSLAADALAAWGLRGDTQWPSVDRAAALYEACSMSSRRKADSVGSDDSVNISDLNPFLATNDSAAELATRLAARYQDGGFFWLDAAPMYADLKLRLQLKVNKRFLENAENQEESISRLRRRSFEKSLPGSDVGRDVLTAMDHVFRLWKKAGNLSVYKPVLIAVEELDKYGLISSILIKELNQGGGAVLHKTDRIEVTNGALASLIKELLQTSNIKAYLAWEFLEHRKACTSSIDLEENIIVDGCFDCVERVAGLAAHAPFLFTSHETESQAKVSIFVQQVKAFVLSSVAEAKWLPERHQERLIEHLFRLEFVRGMPARKEGMAQLSDYYAYLPKGTHSFVDDYSAAARAAWKRSLTRTVESFPLLSASPNVLVRNNTVFVPAVALVPPLFSYGEVESAQYSFLSVALIRAVLHSLGLTGLQSMMVADIEIARHINILARCLGLDTSARDYSSRLADVMAMDTALRVFGIGQEEHVVFDSCFFMCTANDPRRCDMPAGQAAQLENVFACPRQSPTTRYKKCSVW